MVEIILIILLMFLHGYYWGYRHGKRETMLFILNSKEYCSQGHRFDERIGVEDA